ncbi:MAG: hypothetical protein HOP17_05650 [Acidobacteria bacterium]|nr:hypothetical protein [Acidobacteriota bacterium]
MTWQSAAGIIQPFSSVMSGLLKLFNSRFDAIDLRSVELLSRLPEDRLFWKPDAVETDGEPHSCGELIIRSAAAIEQTFGGITRRLWDDPFEWTLPEELADKDRIAAYLNEVTAARINGFAFFKDEAELSRQIPAPDSLKTIAEILLETVDRSSHLQGRAYGIAQQFVRLRPYLA